MIQAVPKLKALLTDHTVTCSHSKGISGRIVDYYGVQVAAAKALIAIIGTEAMPLIESLLPKANYVVRDDLLDGIAELDVRLFDVIATSSSNFLLATWHRLAESDIKGVRVYANRAIIGREPIEYIYSRPELVEDENEQTRLFALHDLVKRGDGDKRAIPLFRQALGDVYWLVRQQAVQGLIKYKPDDIVTILHLAMHDEHLSIRIDAMTELIARGDSKALSKLIDRIQRLKKHSNLKQQPEKFNSEEWEAAELCRLIMKFRIVDARPALEQALANEYKQIRFPVLGAHAALDEEVSLYLLRGLVTGQASISDKTEAMKQLSLIGDTEILPALREALKEKDSWIRQSARAAIKRLKE